MRPGLASITLLPVTAHKCLHAKSASARQKTRAIYATQLNQRASTSGRQPLVKDRPVVGLGSTPPAASPERCYLCCNASGYSNNSDIKAREKMPTIASAFPNTSLPSAFRSHTRCAAARRRRCCVGAALAPRPRADTQEELAPRLCFPPQAKATETFTTVENRCDRGRVRERGRGAWLARIPPGDARGSMCYAADLAINSSRCTWVHAGSGPGSFGGAGSPCSWGALRQAGQQASK